MTFLFVVYPEKGFHQITASKSHSVEAPLKSQRAKEYWEAHSVHRIPNPAADSDSLWALKGLETCIR